MLSFTLVALFGFFLNLATYNCTMKNSPFAIALTHNIKVINIYNSLRIYFQLF